MRIALSPMRIVVASLAAVALVAAVPVAALAQDSLSDPKSAQYDPDDGTGTFQGGGDPGDPAGAAATEAGGGGLNSNIGSLPFTGMDLIILFGVALVLTGSGLAVRRLSAPRSGP